MLDTYRAVLNGDKVTWLDAPPHVSSPVEVRISLLTRATKADRGMAMASALQKIAQIRGAADFNDPVRWQREMREDRPLPRS